MQAQFAKSLRFFIQSTHRAGKTGAGRLTPEKEPQLHRIEGNVMPRNKASLRVLEKNHFVNEGISRAYLKINGVWEDHVHMVRLNDAMQ